ncbi:MAG: dihydrofolate reductase family protein, partial [Planctomycetia bacterium]
RRWTNVLVEGGPGLLGGFLDADAVDAVRAYVAPLLVGGAAAPGPTAGAGRSRLVDALRLGPPTVELFDGDLFLSAVRPVPPPPPRPEKS